MNVIDSLVVSLALDAKKFTNGSAEANAKLDDLIAHIKKVTQAEKDQAGANRKAEEYRKENDRQARQGAAWRKEGTDRVTKATRGLEVQSARAAKQMDSAAASASEFLKLFKGGAAALGAAAGVYALDKFVTDTAKAEAGVNRLGRTLGVSTGVLYRWGKAAERLVPGATSEGIQGAFARLSSDAANLRTGQAAPVALLQAAARMARYNGGAPVQVLGADGQLLPDEQILQNFADPAKRAGPQNALSILGDEFGPDMAALLGLGRSKLTSELSKIKGPGDGDFDQGEHLWRNVKTFGQLLGQGAMNLANRVIPALNVLSDAIVSATGYITGQTSRHDFIESTKGQDPDTRPGAYNAQQAHDRAEAIARTMPLAKGGSETWGAYARRLLKGSTFHTKTDTLASWWHRMMSGGDEGRQARRVARLTALMMGGLSADQAKEQLIREESGAPQMRFTGAGINSLLDAIRQVESGGNPNAVSPKGARGAYQMMPDTARQYGVTDPTNEDQERRGAAAYLQDLLTRYNGDTSKALAAYNWGPGRLDRDIAAHGDAWASFLPPETAAYIPKVLGASSVASAASGGGGSSVSIAQITINTAATDAKGIAREIKGAVVTQFTNGAS